MAGRKRAVDPTARAAAGSSSKKAKRQVEASTFEKWQREFESEHQTMEWLCCDLEPGRKTHVATLYCSACRKFKGRILGLKNFSMAWIAGSTNHKTSNVVDHANSEQHKAAMAHVRAEHAKASNQPVTTYATIARCLFTLDGDTRGRLRKKFDLCYLMAKEGIAFAKYPALHALEVRHEVNLGTAYAIPDSAKLFTSYLANSQRQAFLTSVLGRSHFYSFLMDGTTDAGNQEDELIVLQHFFKDDLAREIRSSTQYFSVHTKKLMPEAC